MLARSDSIASRWTAFGALLASLALIAPLTLLSGCPGEEAAAPPPAPKPIPPTPRAKPAARPAIGTAPKPVEAAPSGPAPVPIDRANEPLAKVSTVSMIADPPYELDTSGPNPADGERATMILPPAGFDRSRVVMSRRDAPPITRPVPEGFVAATEIGSPDGYALAIRHPLTNTTLRFVPGGPFPRGVDSDHPEADAEAGNTPRHTVSVSPFYLAETETTLEAYRTFLDAVPNQTGRRVASRDPTNRGDPRDYPALGLTYRNVVAYCDWFGGRLPTEAEWEKAARTAKGFDNVWGQGEPLFHTDRQPGQIVSVASDGEDRSLYGIYDLAGNAREWTGDLFAANTYRQDALSSPLDPTGPKRGGERVIRGRDDRFSVVARAPQGMSTPNPTLGFRVAVPAGAE